MIVVFAGIEKHPFMFFQVTAKPSQHFPVQNLFKKLSFCLHKVIGFSYVLPLSV
jgi:hypothetical protein